MAKHMRLQHNILPPLPGRGGPRKRKRDDGIEVDVPQQGYTAFKVEGHTPTDAPWDAEDGVGLTPPVPGDERGERDYFSGNGHGHGQRSVTPDRLSAGSDGERDEPLPAYLLAARDPQTGRIHGRPEAMVRYLLMKARWEYQFEQHEMLLEELRTARYEEREARAAKDEALDQVLGMQLGCARFLSSFILL